MREQFFPGAWYGDVWPSGERIVMYPGPEQDKPETAGRIARVETDKGDLSLPVGERYGPMFVRRCKPSDGFRVAGLMHDVGSFWEHAGTRWDKWGYVGGRADYVNGALQDIAPAGIGYVDDAGRPVPFTESHEPKHGVSQWSETAGLTIGQGHDARGVLVYDGSALRVIDTGSCNEIRVHRDGDNVSVTYRKDGAGLYSRIYTLAELRSLPVLDTGPVDPPSVTPPPPPEIPMTPNRVDIAQAVAAQYPDLVKLNTSGACGRLTEYIAQVLHQADSGWGLLSKSPGEHQYNGHAIDAVIYRPTQQVIDLMSGAGDRDPDSGVPIDQQHDIRIKWDEVAKRPGNEWMDPGGDVPPPPPQPPPDDDAIKQLTKSVAALNARADSQQAQLIGIKEELVGAANAYREMTDRITALEQRPTTTGGHVKGKTSKAGGGWFGPSHAHDIDLPVEP